MGFDTMRSFSKLTLYSTSPSPRDIDGDDAVDDGLQRQDSFMFNDNIRQRGGIWAARIPTDSEAGRSIMRDNKPELPLSAPPPFQATKAKWSPPASPGASSPADSPISSPCASCFPADSPRSMPAKPSLTAKEKNALANQLFDAACTGDLDSIESLLARGATIDSSVLVQGLFESFKPAKAGHISALAGAATHGQFDAAELLLAHGAQLNPTTSQSACSPLHQAIRNNDFELVRFFLERGADVNINNSYKTTPLMYACKYGSAELVALLLEYKPDLGRKSFIGVTAIHWSVWPGKTEITELLLKAKADPNHPMADGNTPLHCAVISGSVSLTKLLLKYGADPLRPNESEETPLQLAESQSSSEAITNLLKAAASARS